MGEEVPGPRATESEIEIRPATRRDIAGFGKKPDGVTPRALAMLKADALSEAGAPPTAEQRKRRTP